MRQKLHHFSIAAVPVLFCPFLSLVLHPCTGSQMPWYNLIVVEYLGQHHHISFPTTALNVSSSNILPLVFKSSAIIRIELSPWKSGLLRSWIKSSPYEGSIYAKYSFRSLSLVSSIFPLISLILLGSPPASTSISSFFISGN